MIKLHDDSYLVAAGSGIKLDLLKQLEAEVLPVQVAKTEGFDFYETAKDI